MCLPHCQRACHHPDHEGVQLIRVMRGATLAFLALLAACSPRGSTGLGSGPPGLDVADAALRGGSPEIALQISGGILATDPNNEAALLTQGEALTALQRLDQAEVSFSKALAANPTSVGAHIGLGRIRLGSDPAAAEALFLEAIKREPRNGVALNDLGIARDLQGRHTDAQEAYRQALGVNPDMTAAQVNLALSLAMTGKSQDAVQLLRPLATRPEAPPSCVMISRPSWQWAATGWRRNVSSARICRRTRCSWHWALTLRAVRERPAVC